MPERKSAGEFVNSFPTLAETLFQVPVKWKSHSKTLLLILPILTWADMKGYTVKPVFQDRWEPMATYEQTHTG